MRFSKVMGSGASNWTIPNALTVARILFTPLFVVFFLDGNHLAALSIFFLAGATDALDGLLASGCVGQLPEILDGDAPHTPRGCDAQAWSATEGLRVWLTLDGHS